MASKVSVGKTAPVPLGQQPAANSLPVVFAEDQQPIPVEEQNKIQSEVALSLLGIPRAEVALGIFADVNTYDINPTEWAQFPIENTANSISGKVTYGVEHIPEEAGARLVATDGNTTLLTSKRFFRYQPGRVSASTMGVKMNITPDPYTATGLTTTVKNSMKGAPSLKKWGIFDKFDGYYFEVANSGVGNDFRCVRRTQAIIPSEQAGYSGSLSWIRNTDGTEFNTSTSFGEAGKDPVIIRDGLVYVAAAIYDPSLCYAPDDCQAIDGVEDTGTYAGTYSGAGERLKNYNFDSRYAVRLATWDGSNWTEKMADRKFMFPFDQSSTVALEPEDTSISRGYIRADAHCNFYQVISNANRKGNYNSELGAFSDFKGANHYANWGVTQNVDPTEYNDLDTWDPSPTEDNNNKKIWHLLVNTQGGTATPITTAHLNRNDIPDRTVTNGNVTLKEWFNTCVPKPYRMVYEWRPVRAMFSGDKLDGAESVVRWSDINTAANDTTAGNGSGGAVNRPGDPVKTADGEDLKTQSAYNVDFSKVTMWKTEFSWYGAVGAVFLCYVPVANGEARWLRVHHIRASNQHSVASLGNATLPITYLTHGGINSQLMASGGNTLTKYGASYYIDGGDKGTVRLLSKASDYSRNVSPGFINIPADGGNTVDGGWGGGGTNVLSVSASYNGSDTRKAKITFNTAVGLMGAYVEGDITNKVKWVGYSGNDIKLYFENTLPSDSNAIKLVIPRAQKSLLSFRAKDFILNRKGDEVRNRLQIYPIKLGAGIAGGGGGDLMTLRTIKNPLKIVSNRNFSSGGSTLYGQDSGTISIVRDPLTTTNPYVNTKTSTLAVEVGFASTNSINKVLADGAYRYGYFMGSKSVTEASGFDPTNTSDIISGTMFPVLGKVKRVGTKYYFSKLFSYPEPVYIAGYFLPERNLSMGEYLSTGNGYDVFTEESVTANNHDDSTDQSKWDKLDPDNLVTWEEITRLSGARVGQDMKLTPIAETGNEILAYYGGTGGYQFDLQDYFAYNKEYLSFPLTDEVDILNIYGHYDINQAVLPAPFFVNTALTWEEQ